jgi:predicted Fe-Mo cluster-binding NifX family protein
LRVAFAAWNGRIAPVFDVARHVHLVDIGSSGVAAEADELVEVEAPVRRAARLAALGVQTLVCGAISRPQRAALEAYGLNVVPLVAGGLREVVDSWRSGARS